MQRRRGILLRFQIRFTIFPPKKEGKVRHLDIFAAQMKMSGNWPSVNMNISLVLHENRICVVYVAMEIIKFCLLAIYENFCLNFGFFFRGVGGCFFKCLIMHIRIA